MAKRAESALTEAQREDSNQANSSSVCEAKCSRYREGEVAGVPAEAANVAGMYAALRDDILPASRPLQTSNTRYG